MFTQPKFKQPVEFIPIQNPPKSFFVCLFHRLYSDTIDAGDNSLFLMSVLNQDSSSTNNLKKKKIFFQALFGATLTQSHN